MSLNDRIHEAAHACLYAHANGEAVTFTGDDLLALAHTLAEAVDLLNFPWRLTPWARQMARADVPDDIKHGEIARCERCHEFADDDTVWAELGGRS